MIKTLIIDAFQGISTQKLPPKNSIWYSVYGLGSNAGTLYIWDITTAQKIIIIVWQLG